MMTAPDFQKRYTMGFKETITPDQKKNLENVAAQLARTHVAADDEYAISYIGHTFTFVFETNREDLYQNACKAFNELEPSLKNLQSGGVISNARIKKAGTETQAPNNDNVTWLKQVALNDQATEQPKYIEFIKRAITYYLDSKLKRSKEDLSITLEDNMLTIKSKSLPDGEIMEIIFRSFAADPKFTILDNQALSNLYRTTRNAYTTETRNLRKNPAAKPADTGVRSILPTHFEEREFNRNDIPGLRELKATIPFGKRSTTQQVFQLAAFGGASFRASQSEQFITVSLPIFADPKRTELIQNQIMKGLNRLAHLAQLGQLKRMDQASVTKAFDHANKGDISRSRSTNATINSVLNPKKQLTPKGPEPVQFSLPRIDEKHTLKSEDKVLDRFSTGDVTLMKAFNDKSVVLSMTVAAPDEAAQDSKVRPIVYHALDNLKRKQYHKIIVAGAADHFNHMRDVVEEIDFLLGHGDPAKGRAIRDKLSDENRIEITDTPLNPGEECRQAFILLNGAQEYTYEQLWNVISKLPDTSTTRIAFVGNDEKYNDLGYASNYKFFFDTLTKDPGYARMVAGFLPEDQERPKNPLIERMLMNGHNKPPQIISQQSTLFPSPEQK